MNWSEPGEPTTNGSLWGWYREACASSERKYEKFGPTGGYDLGPGIGSNGLSLHLFEKNCQPKNGTLAEKRRRTTYMREWEDHLSCGHWRGFLLWASRTLNNRSLILSVHRPGLVSILRSSGLGYILWKCLANTAIISIVSSFSHCSPAVAPPPFG